MLKQNPRKSANRRTTLMPVASTVSVCNPCASEPTMHECVCKLIIKHLTSGQANMDAKKLKDKPIQTSLIKFKPV